MLLVGLYACETTKLDPAAGESSQAQDGAEFSVLTPTEEDIIRAFRYEVDEDWLEAAILYDKLARSSIQPERSKYLLKVALMYYRGGLYDEIDPYFESLGEEDILEADQNKPANHPGRRLPRRRQDISKPADPARDRGNQRLPLQGTGIEHTLARRAGHRQAAGKRQDAHADQ